MTNNNDTKNKDSFKSGLKGVVIGAGIAVAASKILSNKKVKKAIDEKREEIKKGMSKTFENMKEEAEEIKEKTEDKMENAKEHMSKNMKEAKDKLTSEK